MAEAKKKRGRPSLYKDEYCEQARKLCRLGAIDTELAEFFGVTVTTLNNWKIEHPDFFESLKAGRALADANVGEALYQRALGYSHKAVKIFVHHGVPVSVPYTEHYPPDSTACIFWLKNRRPDLWRDKPEPENEDDTPPEPKRFVFEVIDGRKNADTDAPTG